MDKVSMSYSQTCSNDNHHYKTTNAESSQASSRTIVATSDHFFLSPKGKKTCLKQRLQNITQRRNWKQTGYIFKIL